MITTLTGGQFGSEGKGLIAGHLGKDYSVHVRVGAANAGHTVYTAHPDLDLKQRWQKHVVQQLPCAAYSHPTAQLVLGPGALISPSILQEEIERNQKWRRLNGHPALHLWVDHRAHVITASHIRREQETDLAERIGSTSTIAREGIGAATAARIMREDDCILADEFLRGDAWEMCTTVDTRDIINDPGRDVLLEGTQGTGLSITTGFFPYCTSRNTVAPGLIADCGADLRLVKRRIVVFRSFPIRVAGNSGPFWHDSCEIDWDKLAVDPESERTTVTKKVRRVATFSYEQMRDAILLNGATELALTFVDYIDPAVYGQQMLTDEAVGIVADYERAAGVSIKYVGTGPHTVIER